MTRDKTKRYTWSAIEDEMLLEAVNKIGNSEGHVKNWRESVRIP